MTSEDFIVCPFERRHFGRKNEFVFRHHSYHAEQGEPVSELSEEKRAEFRAWVLAQ